MTTAAAITVDAAAAQNSPLPWIDAHVHVWTDDLTNYPLAPGFTKADMKPAKFLPADLFAHCRPAGVGRIVLIQMIYYKTNNAYMLAVMKEHPGVFGGVAIIDSAKEPAAKMRELLGLGVRGFRIGPDAKFLEQPGMETMWQTAAVTGQSICCLINPESLVDVDRWCTKFGDTPVVIDHFARIGVTGAINEDHLSQLCKLARFPKVKVKVSAYYALGKKAAPYTDLAPMIKRLLDVYGPSRLMWASDCPFQVDPPHNYADSIALVRDKLGLSTTDRDWLLRQTAEQTFFAAS